MLFTVGSAIQMKVQYLVLRDGIYQFYLRVPKDLAGEYGKNFIRFSLKTSDPTRAAKLAEANARRYKSEFKVLRDGNPLTPEDIKIAGRLLAEKYDMNLDHFINFEVDPAREKYANGDEENYRDADPSEYLTPTQTAAWQLMARPNVTRLSDVLKIYLKTHSRGNEEAFITKTSRDWKMLIKLVGDIEFDKLSRAHTRQIVDDLTFNGFKTGSIRRTLNTLRAITRKAITELEISKADPFKSITIQNEGNDKEEGRVATPQQLREIVTTFMAKKNSAVAMIIILQMELGSRISEISGLGLDDIFLNEEIPYIYFRDKPWRSLKNNVSERRVPVSGLALEALKAALALPRTNQGIFNNYAKNKGGSAASAAINAQLKKWGLKSHDFRHTMKDRLREIGCPKDIRDAIQGHGSNDIADNYGHGHSLKTMLNWMQKVELKKN
jgi:integrase